MYVLLELLDELELDELEQDELDELEDADVVYRAMYILVTLLIVLLRAPIIWLTSAELITSFSTLSGTSG